MPNYLLAYHGGGMPETEEEGARVKAAWGQWMGKVGAGVQHCRRPRRHAIAEGARRIYQVDPAGLGAIRAWLDLPE